MLLSSLIMLGLLLSECGFDQFLMFIISSTPNVGCIFDLALKFNKHKSRAIFGILFIYILSIAVTPTSCILCLIVFQIWCHWCTKHVPYWLHPSCIDLIIPDQPNLILDCGTWASLDPYCHHQIIHCKVNFRISSPPRFERKIWHFNRTNIAAIRSMTSSLWFQVLILTIILIGKLQLLLISF